METGLLGTVSYQSTRKLGVRTPKNSSTLGERKGPMLRGIEQSDGVETQLSRLFLYWLYVDKAVLYVC